MIVSFIKEIIIKKKIRETIFLVYKYYKYYKKLKTTIKNNSIFLKNGKQDDDFIKLIKKMSPDDYNLIKKLFNSDIKEFLAKQNLKFQLNFVESKDFIQVDQNFINVEEPIQGLWTTGKSTIFMPVVQGKNNYFKVNLFSIVPIQVEVGFNEIVLKKFKMGSLSTTVIEFVIHKSEIKNKVIEIFLKTDKLWFPNVITGGNDRIPIGVAIRSISNYTS